MRWYWARIGLGALAIFVVGYGTVLIVRRATAGVRSAVSSGISIPASLIPFRVDGAPAGSITRVRVVRGEGTSPDIPVSLAIRVDLGEAAPALVSGCLLLLDELTQVETGAPFRCLREAAADSVPGYLRFGEVEVRQRGQVIDRLPLLVPESERSTLATTSRQALEDRLKTAQEAAESDRFRREARRIGDSLAALVPAGADSL